MNTQISSLIEDQLPGFITAEYENFTKVLEGYYEQLESTGQPLDIISNITNYRDIDYYEKHLLKERSTLSSAISSTDTQVTIEDGSSFPEKNGYIKIDTEILFYKERDGNILNDVSRGVSGTTTLGDLYNENSYSDSIASAHASGVNVDNLSHLFLYALTKAFEREYLDSFPEAYLKDDVDKRTLIKNIGSFYKVKGNDKSIRFIFNTIISKSAEDVPTTYNPKDNTLKVSTSDWDSTYALQAVVLSGDVDWLLGEQIIQQKDRNLPNLPYASAVVENILQIGKVGTSGLYNLILSPSSLNGEFVIPQQTVLNKNLISTDGVGDFITVDSTFGWKGQQGSVVINGEKIKYSSKSARYFTIEERGNITQTHGAGDKVYSYSTATAKTDNGVVTLLIYGVLTRLEIDEVAPYSQAGDRVQVSNPGFETRDPVLYDEFAQNYRWKVNVNATSPSVPLNPVIATSLSDYISDVSAVYEDQQYYYFATSSYPSTDILTANVNDTLTDPQLLKLIPKTITTTTEVYKTPRSDVGIFVDGSIVYNVKDSELIGYGPITSFDITKRGSGYQKPPFVLINGLPGKAKAILTGDSVSSIESISTDSYTAAPIVDIVSGRNADLQAVVTSGSITSIRIINSGEYYSSPPAIIITDDNGKGRFAQYNAVISTEGKIIDVVKVDGGKFYTQENVKVVVIPDALYSGSTATSSIYEWVKNRFYDNSQNIDDNGGIVVTNSINEKHYGVVGNPKRLRYRLSDNLTSTTLEETQTLTHSPILGFAYDGHPIYGPYGHQDPLDDDSTIVRMNSGYSLKSSREGGPVQDTGPYPMGTFIDDYEWIPNIQTGKTRLDRNNGRFCVTPEFPQGVYAYFLTIDEDNNSVYPHIIGDNFYSVPVASNYDYNIKQDAIPPQATRLYIDGTLKNGDGEIALIENTSSGSVSGVHVEDSEPIYTIGSKVYVDDTNTGGVGASGVVSSTYGKTVESIESVDVKAVLLTAVTPLYSFAGDTITQPSTGATGELLRDTIEETTFVVRNVQGTFDPETDISTSGIANSNKTISSSSLIVNLLLSQDSTYSKDAILSLVEKADTNVVIATGKVLTATSNQNSVRILVESGNYSDYLNYPVGDTILKSSDISNTAATEITIVKQLSKDIIIVGAQDNIAIVETDGDHNMGEGDVVNVEIDPDESTTESTYWVRRKKFQELDLIPVTYNGKLNDTGIGSSSLIGYGRDYVSGTYTDVDLIFSSHTTSRDVTSAKARIVVESSNWDGSGNISSIEITDAGSGYLKDDILTIDEADIPKITPANSSVVSDLNATLTNASELNTYLQKKFTVGPNDWSSLTTWLDGIGIGQPFDNDAGDKTFYYLSYDSATFTVNYALFVNNQNDLTTLDTLNGGIAILSILEESPPGTPQPQYRFYNDSGDMNPDYQIRVGSTFTFDAITDHPVRIVLPGYQTSLKSDNVALQLDSYTDADNVTGQGAVTGDIVFTPTYTGVFYYIDTLYPEAVGKITVLNAPDPMPPLLVVNSVGLGVERTDAVLESVYSLSNGDLLKINDEILKVVGVDNATRKVTFDRGQDNTEIVNHSLGASIKSHKPQYRFTFDDKVFGTGINDPRVISYDNETHKLLLAFDFAHEGATNPLKITDVSTFEDHSTPAKLVSISKAFDKVEKLQFSPDNSNFETNPVLQIQKYYFYKFDTSHPSMLGSYLDISTSPNYNIFTEEKEVNLIEPGNQGANIRIRLGYGPNIGDIKRKAVNFISYYYFLTTEDIDTGGSYLKVQEDPLAGNKTIIYRTPDKFVYNLSSIPQYDGSGMMRYTGKSVGKIATVTLDNLGFGYKSLPSVKGVVPAPGYKAEVIAVRNIVSGKITELTISNSGQGYVKPKAVVSGDGKGLEIALTLGNGSIVKAEIIKEGSGYTYTPSIEIVETNNKLFFESSEIGTPESIRFVRYGSGYHNDTSILPLFTSPSIFVLSAFDQDAFEYGEIVEQRVNNIVVASGKVSKNGWVKGINTLRLENIKGVFRSGYSIINKQRGKTAFIDNIMRSTFKPVIETRENRIGKFTSDRGKVSSLNQRITDSNFYQDYSYVVRSRTPIKQWRSAIKDTTHPAGFQLFGEVYMESEASNRMNPVQLNTQNLTTYLCIPAPKITGQSVTRTITETILGTANIQSRRGFGSVSVDAFDETMTRVREITLSPAFDGLFDSDTGQSVGTTEFTIIDKVSGSAYTPYNEQELMISLDGVVQQPIRTYTVTGNQIKFYEAPLGPRMEEGVLVPPVSLYGKAFKFRENNNNVRYLKRLRDISEQFDGRQKNFDLYYEDGGIVKTDLNENLLLYLDGILQQDSYTVRRFVSANKTDRLIFKKAPQNFADLYEGLPDSLQGEQYFHGHTVGSYQRLHIDENVIPFSTSNSYLILDENNRVQTFDDPLYAYVFVNGVLQRHIESYRIVGPSIIFNRPLEYALQSDGSYTTAKVQILYFYGKDYEPTLTFFDHEQDVYFNRTTITIDGKYNDFNSWYGPKASEPTSVYQIINGVKESWGYIIDVQKGNGEEWQLIMRSHNIEYIDGDKIYITRKSGTDLELAVSSISVSYNTNSSGERLLNRIESNLIPWLNTTDISDSYEYRGELIKEHPSLKKGDLIKIDGEFDYREVVSTPLIAKSKQYNAGKQVSNSFFAKVKATQYNGDVYGEGFTVTAAVKEGVVTTLSWNKRDLELFFNNNILLNPTAYNYYTPPVINFIPVDGKGGGAKAEVLVHGGQILDIVLIDGGEGYETAPRCVVSRGYDVIRQNDTFESSVEVVINGQAGVTIAGGTSEDFLWRTEPLDHEVSLVSPMVSLLVTLHRWHMPVRNTTFQAHEQFITKIITPQPPEPKVMSSSGSTTTSMTLKPKIAASYITYEHPVTKYKQSGVIDMLEQPVENSSLFTQGKLGTTVATFMEYLFMDHGEFNVSGINIEQFEIFYPFLAINQNPHNWMENYTIDYTSITSSGVLFNPGIPSIHDRGGNLDQAFNIGDTILYITGSTAHFPASGKLLVGKEVVEYDGTLNNDRFTISARGVNGTVESDHLAGDYFRTLGKYN